MLSFLADEDFNGRIVRGLMRTRNKNVDLVRVQDVGLQEASDESILQWADEQGRIVLTHDARTMPFTATKRLRAASHFPGLFVVRRPINIGVCISDLLLVAECSEPDEWRDVVTYLPLK